MGGLESKNFDFDFDFGLYSVYLHSSTFYLAVIAQS